MMRIRVAPLGLLVLISACTAGPAKGPVTAVSTPSVGRPDPPASVQAALSQEAFTPYAALGQSDNDGLAPGESEYSLSKACLAVAGYPNSETVPFGIRLGPANLAFSQPWGQWGYLGTVEARQYGFRVPPGSALTALGIDAPPSDFNPASLPQAEQTAINKCATIQQDFDNTVQNGALAGIDTLSNDIASDVVKDAAVSGATKSWTACMARNGYSFTQPQNVFFQELRTMYGAPRQGGINASNQVSAAANQAQIATAVADAGCTQSADLAGIYFAVQASYEQQLVNANANALTSAVQRYRAAYAKELKQLPALFKTASAQPPGKTAPAAGRPTSASG